jgi:Uma2 family endonuclease
MAYYKGTLEFMSPRYRHEKYSRRLDRLVWELVVELEVPCAFAGSTTFRKEGAEAGKEPDACFYFANEPLIRDKEEIDLAVDPPPDLAIEVDNFSNSEGKLPIYAALRVPEVWRYDVRAGVLWFGRLQTDGTYAAITHSESLPLLTPARVLEALNLCRGVPESRWGRLLREWIRGLSA